MTKPTAMNISDNVLDSAANLIQGAMDGMPVEGEVDWKKLDNEEAEALEAILDEVSHGDLRFVARRAAERVAAQAQADGVSVVWS